MSFFRKRPVAVAVLVLSIVAAVLIGQLRKPPAQADYPVIAGDFICVDDQAGLLSESTKQYIQAVNESLFYQSGAMVFVGTVPSTGRTDILDYADDLGTRYGVGSKERNNGVVILLAPENVLSDGLVGDYAVSLGTGLERYSGELEELVFEMEDDFAAGRYDQAARTAFDEYVAWFEDFYAIQVRPGYFPDISDPREQYSTPTAQSAPWAEHTGGASILPDLLTLLVILLLIWVILDGIRYSRYRRRYRSYDVPPVIYRPIFWGRPRRRPPPPPPPHYGGPGPRPPVSRPTPPPRPSSPSGGFHSGGSFGGGGASRSSRPSSPPRSSRPSGGFSRPSGGGSKSSAGGFSRGGSFGGGGASRGGGSRGGGASRGGRR